MLGKSIWLEGVEVLRVDFESVIGILKCVIVTQLGYVAGTELLFPPVNLGKVWKDQLAEFLN